MFYNNIHTRHATLDGRTIYPNRKVRQAAACRHTVTALICSVTYSRSFSSRCVVMLREEISLGNATSQCATEEELKSGHLSNIYSEGSRIVSLCNLRGHLVVVKVGGDINLPKSISHLHREASYMITIGRLLKGIWPLWKDAEGRNSSSLISAA